MAEKIKGNFSKSTTQIVEIKDEIYIITYSGIYIQVNCPKGVNTIRDNEKILDPISEYCMMYSEETGEIEFMVGIYSMQENMTTRIGYDNMPEKNRNTDIKEYDFVNKCFINKN